jgi:RNA polymerase sigma factor (sigma-70 family)
MNNYQSQGAPVHKSELSNDNWLAEQAKRRPIAFGELYERYVDAVFRFCSRRVDSQHAAEDLTASVFERALARIDTFRGGSFRAWLFRIAHNAVTDHYRRQKPVISWEPELSGPDDAPTPEDHVIAYEQRAQLRTMLNDLTDDQRQVVELRLAGLTGAEIAEAIQRSPDAVKMLQYRALARMRSHRSTPAEDAKGEHG